MNFINCEYFAELAKPQNHRQDLQSKENMQAPFLAAELYRNSFEHLQDELTRIGMLICFVLENTRAEADANSQDFLGMFILEAEANSILQTVCCGSETFRAQELKSEEIEALERKISTKKTESLKRGIELKLHTLSKLFSLTPFETDILLIGLAP